MNPRSIDKKQAQELIKETFESSFDKNGFTNFIKNLLNRIDEDSFTYQGQFIPDSYKPFISKYIRVGKFNDGENRIDILIVYLNKNTSIERARTMQRNFIAGYLQGKYGSTNEKNAALVAFVSPGKADWRFSLVKLDYFFKQRKDGIPKAIEEFTPARRWSFLVGANEKSHTAQSQMVKILADDEHDPTLTELEQAFDIETVTKEFFKEYRDLFIRTKEELDRVVKKDPKIKADFEDNGVDTVNFAKKLLGQIVFLYFLQKKGWFGVGRDDDWGTGSKHFFRELFEKKHADYNNFFNDILEPLFYEALRTGEDRKHEDYYYSRFNCKIPFLNGGLFDPIGNYDWVHTDIYLPDKLFSNQNKTKEGDTGDGILDIFDRYNFTVKEDEPLEKEVAIDPELLGKSYEKFNAIRPDNCDEFKKALKSGRKGEENKFNKKFGVYYTPREIVHYMCRQSLINYLNSELNSESSSYQKLGDSQLDMFGNKAKKGQLDLTIEHKAGINIRKEDIETLIHAGEQFSENEARVLRKGKETKTYSHQLPESIRKNAKLIDDKLEEITVCDPAVGSGAFPVGMMSEIVKARNVLSTFLPVRGTQTGVQDNTRTPYEFKRRCIEHSLYGVDIDPGAVEIAKLRLWLSLVVDEDDIKNIKPLPNLDYKIMQGNSLIELLSAESLASTIDHKRTELVKELKKAKDELFNITIPTQKENKRREIDILMKKLFEYDRDKQIKRLKDDILAVKSQQRLFEDDKDKKEDEKKIRKIESRIEEIKNIDIPEPTEHFEWYVNYSEIFQEKGGFDVVIANPPYVKEAVNRSAFNGLRNTECYQGKMDLWYLFGSKGLDVLRNDGAMCFIATNNWISNDGASKLRNKVVRQGEIVNFIDFRNYKVFAAGIQTMVFLVLKNSEKKEYVSKYAELLNEKVDNTLLSDFLNESSDISTSDYTKFNFRFRRNDFRDKYINFIPSNIDNVLEKMESSEVLYLADNEIFSGIDVIQDFVNKNHIAKLGNSFSIGDGIFVLSNDEKNRIPWNASEIKLVKPYYTTKEVSRYSANNSNRFWIIYTRPEINNKISDYPHIKRHLDQFQQVITSVNKPYGLHRTRNQQIFLGEKLLSIRKCSRPSFSFVNFPCYVSRAFLTIKTKRANLKYLLALLNSKIVAFWLFYKGKLQGNLFQVDKVPLLNIPIKNITFSKQEPFVDVVDKILNVTKGNDYLENPGKQAKIEELTKQIDQLVYKLYELTPEEIKIVEGEKAK